MVLRKTIVLINCVFCLLLNSCLEAVKKIQDWTQIQDENNIEGKKHHLGDDGIKIFLPKSFKRYNSVEYIALIDSLVTDNKNLEIERTRFRNIRKMEGNHYVFFDNTINTTYTINAVPYTPISRQDAKYILGIIRQSQKAISDSTNLDYTKITGKHNDNGTTQIFKAIFKVENQELQQQAFQNVYFISSNNKTVLINLMTPFEVNFDPFLEKMTL